jgi:hypothetical protein
VKKKNQINTSKSEKLKFDMKNMINSKAYLHNQLLVLYFSFLFFYKLHYIFSLKNVADCFEKNQKKNHSKSMSVILDVSQQKDILFNELNRASS